MRRRSRVLAMLGVAGLGTLFRGEIGAAQVAGRRSGAVSFARPMRPRLAILRCRP